MAFFKGSLAKEGKGVEKDEQKSAPALFFEIYFRKFWKLCQVGIVYLLACIPTFIVASSICGIITDILMSPLKTVFENAASMADPGNSEGYYQLFRMIVNILLTLFLTALWGMGPATAGFTYVLRNYAREEHAWPWSDFREFTFKNFRQAICVWAIDMVVLWMLINAYMFYASLLKYVVACIILAYTLMHFYIYQLMVTYKLSIKEIYKYSFLFAVVALPVNILTLFFVTLIHFGLIFLGINIPFLAGSLGYWTIYIILALFVLQGTSGLLINFVAHRTVKKYMRNEEEKSENVDDKKYLV